MRGPDHERAVEAVAALAVAEQRINEMEDKSDRSQMISAIDLCYNLLSAYQDWDDEP